MINTGKKILLLGLVIAAAVSGILVFYPTIVAPPTDVPVTNLHSSSLENDISGFTEIENMRFNDSIYDIVVDKLQLYKSEAFIDENGIDYQTSVLVQSYVPVFVNLCHAKFNAPKWYDSDHQKMLRSIAKLRELKMLSDKTKAVGGDYALELTQIEKVISNYKKAKKIAGVKKFTNVSEANRYISDAEKYKNMPPLNNCKDLVNRLDAVKSNIGNSHYGKVESKVKSLSNYRNMSETTFNDLVSVVESKIREYNENRSNYGPDAKSSESLSQRAREYFNEARKYYNRKEISINTNYQWTAISSPSYSYRAYCSSSNHNRHSTNATMSFTIKGYESFTFYIRSDGESGCDYVMVGLDYVPSPGSNEANASNPSSGTSMSSYKPVTFNGLNKSRTYTIYVVYRKDHSVNNGSDRGYVLIPNVDNY